MDDLNLDVMAPMEVANVLTRAAAAYKQSAASIRQEWEDPTAGKDWLEIARLLETAADRITSKYSKKKASLLKTVHHAFRTVSR